MVSEIQNEVICSRCRQPITQREEAVICAECREPHHRTCWHTHNACAGTDCDGREVLPLPLSTAFEPTPEYHTEVGRLHDEKPKKTWLFGVGIIALAVISAVIAHQVFHVSTEFLLLIGVVITALGFDFVNGMNDSGNAIATVISTRVLSPFSALIMAAILNLVGALCFEGVAKSIAGKIIQVQPEQMAHAVTPLMILCGLLGAIGWAYTMARIGLPISMSHSLIGGLVGVFLLAGLQLNLTYLGEILLWMFMAPVLGISLGWLLMVAIMWIFRHANPSKMNQQFKIWQVFSSGLMAFFHGSNDAQKAMGIITLALVAGGIISAGGSQGPEIPTLVKVACALVIALGTALGGRKVIGTLGHKIFKLTPVHGFAAETIASLVIYLATKSHIPISTTHIISSSILGVGSSKRLSAVRWGVAGNIVSAWIFTIPTCGAVAALLYLIITKIFNTQ